jgi:hypothetical protein
VPIRVIQWTTGNVGRRALAAIIRHPDLDLVGVYAHGADKVGRDAAELCGLDEPTGVRATHDVDALLGAGAAACSYNPIWPNLDHLCRLLEAGINVSSTAAFITGLTMEPEARSRLASAAERGGASMFGTGANPGFANLFALVSTQICDRIDAVRVLESVDSTTYASKDTEESVGYGLSPDTPGLVELTKAGSRVFEEAVAMMGDALGVEFDEIVFDADYATASADRDLGYMVIKQGTVTGIDGRWRGRAFDRDVVVAHFQWLKGSAEDAPFSIRHGYFVEVDGEPSVRSRFQIRPGPGWSEPDPMGLGMIMTAMPAVNAIPAVVAAPPGIVTYAALPVVTALGYVDRGTT